MNERIREIWSQCVIKHTKTPMNWQDVADEFAELIFAECINCCQKNYAAFYGSHASAHNSAIKKCIDSIEEMKSKN